MKKWFAKAIMFAVTAALIVQPAFATNVGDDMTFEAAVTFQDTTQFGDTAYTWPSTDGTATYVLQTDGSGALSWVANAGGGATAWDDITVPDANTSLDMTTYTTTWDFGGAVDMFTFEFTSAFADVSGLKLEQKTGNPTDGTIFEIEMADSDPDFISLSYATNEVFNVDNAGTISIAGAKGAATTVDANSLDFVGAGVITAAASSAITLNPDSGNAAGEDLIVTAHNVQLTAAGKLTMSPDAAETLAMDLTDTDYTDAISVGDNAILGTTGIINYNNFDVDASGNVTAAGTITGVTIAQDAIVAASADTTLTIDGTGTGGVGVGTASGSGTITMGGSAVLVNLPATVDLTLSGGDFSVTDTANSDLVTLVNDTLTTADIFDISAAGTRTSGNVIKIVDGSTTADTISITADTQTSGDGIFYSNDGAGLTGSFIYADITDGGGFTGYYLRMYDGAADDFSVKRYGATIIGGLANTDMLTVTTGHLQIDDGMIEVDTDEDHASNVTRNFAGAGTGPAFSVVDTHASGTNAALAVTQGGTGASEGILLTHSGDGAAFEIVAGAARTGNVVDMAMANQLGQNGILIDGAWTGASDIGMINLNPTGNIAAGASALRIDTDTGTPGGSGFGIEIDDDSADGGTFYAALINSANNEGLHVEAGLSLFAELTTFTSGVDIDGSVDIDFSSNAELFNINTSTNAYPAGAGAATIFGSDAGGFSNASYLLRLVHKASADAQNNFILCEDNSDGNPASGDDMFKVDYDGAVTAAGTVTVNGANLAGDGSTIMTGILDSHEVVTATNVITASECGKTFYLNSATEFASTLPTAATVELGCEFDFYVKAAPSGASYTIITGASLENILYGGFVEREVDTGDDGPYQAAGDTITIVNGVAVQGDHVHIESDGDVYYVTGVANADGGLTITQAD